MYHDSYTVMKSEQNVFSRVLNRMSRFPKRSEQSSLSLYYLLLHWLDCVSERQQ